MTDRDNTLSAMVVRNILDIESAMEHANGAIRDRLADEFNQMFKSVLDTGDWFSPEKDDFWEDWFCPKDWENKEGKKSSALAKFALNTIGEDKFETWAATFTASSSATGISCILFSFSTTKTIYRKVLSENQEEVVRIQEEGFVIDGDNIYYPISIDAEQLALGFENDDISQAVETFRKAASALKEVMPEFNALHQKLRDATR